MALWEYKVISSGKGGFASATMLETYLNQLGKDEWEIVDFRTDPANALAFNGLARRPTQREWTLEAAVAAAAKAEADKIRAELIHKQHAGDTEASADTHAGGTAGEKAAGPDGLRQLRDTDRDHDPEALADEASHGADDWANLDDYEDDLPTFFDAIKPHLRKNPNTPGQSVALNYLAKRWEQPEADLHGAMKECGFVIPEAETDAPVYLEFEGDLYWVEKNNRGQFFLNTREKPRPKFKVAAGKPLDPSDPVFVALAEEHAAVEAERAKRAAEQAAREAAEQARRAEREAQRLAAEQARREQQAAAQAAREAARLAAQAAAGAATEAAGVANASVAPAPVSAGEVAASPEAAPATQPTPVVAGGVLPTGPALLDAIRPQMRRNRRGPGYSGSSAYLAKFFKVEESALRAAIAELGLLSSDASGAKGEPKTIGAYVYWVNQDGNGGLWINGREANPRERADATKPVTGAQTDTAATVQTAASDAASVTVQTGAEGASAEPPIFRAVPRAMPPVPVASPEPAVSAPAEVVPVATEPVQAEVQPVETPAAPAEDATKSPASRTSASKGDKKVRTRNKPVATEATAEAGAEDADTKPAKVTAKATPRPRTKRRAASAIEQDAAAEE
ncbi:MAG: hypothetical protein MUE42_03975 [Opitutaceae bacterium]|jgi:hypothetical protein|nr:hypothetical protein [Opitutaceae bacterium]